MKLPKFKFVTLLDFEQ